MALKAMKWQYYFVLVCLFIVLLFIHIGTVQIDTGKLWWRTFPNVAMALYRRHRNNHFNENVEFPNPVFFHETYNVCAIDAQHVMRDKLYHTIYDDVFRGITACCAFTGNRTPGIVTLTNASDSEVIHEVMHVFDDNQVFGTAPKTTEDFDQAILTQPDKVTLIHHLALTIPDIQWYLPQPKIRGEYPNQSICAMNFLRRMFRGRTTNVSSTWNNSIPSTILIWGRANGTRSLVNQRQIADDLRTGTKFHKNSEVVSIMDPGKLNFEDQLKLIRNASVLISPHGAGLALMPALSPNTLAIELFAKEYMAYRLFHNIASLLGVQHTWVACDAVKEDTRFSPQKYTFGTPTYSDSPMRCRSNDMLIEVLRYLRQKDDSRKNSVQKETHEQAK